MPNDEEEIREETTIKEQLEDARAGVTEAVLLTASDLSEAPGDGEFEVGALRIGQLAEVLRLLNDLIKGASTEKRKKTHLMYHGNITQ